MDDVALTSSSCDAMISSSMRQRLSVLCILAAMSGVLHAAEQSPVEVSSPHFTLVTEAGEKQARHVLDNFERMRWMFQTIFPKANADPAAPIVVIAVKNRKGFQALEPQEYLAKGQLDLAGLFLTTNEKNYVLLRLDADSDSQHPYATVYHEYTHLQFRSDEEWMPLWLNEGIAEFFQNTDFHDKQVLLGQPSGDDILYLRQHSLIPLPTLFRVDHNSPYYHEENKGSVFYAESWALTHYLQITDRQKNTRCFPDYVMRVSRGEDPVTAAQEAFGDLKALQNQLTAYIHQERYTQFLLNSATASIDPASYKVRALTPPEFDAYRADLLAYVGRASDARALLKTIMDADPKLPGPHETMGYMALQDGDRDSARKWYLEAIHLNSQNYLVYYDFANLAMSKQGVTPQDASSGPQIESSLHTAIQLNPAFAPAYDRLASWYANNHGNLDQAQALELRAVELDRSNFYFRLNASNLFMMRDKLDLAGQVLLAARKLAKTPAQTALADGRIDQIASIRSARAAAANTASVPGVVSTSAEVNVVPVQAPPRHPVEPANGPRHTAMGTILNVECDLPSYMEFQVQIGAKAKPITLYSSDYFNLDLSALGFEAKKEMNPCRDLGGMKAKVQYAESSDKTIDGQIVSIELHK
jgi:tetratricopeptide (TPR) repeat protein